MSKCKILKKIEDCIILAEKNKISREDVLEILNKKMPMRIHFMDKRGYSYYLKELDKVVIPAYMSSFDDNQTTTARRLGISRPSLSKKIDDIGYKPSKWHKKRG